MAQNIFQTYPLDQRDSEVNHSTGPVVIKIHAAHSTTNRNNLNQILCRKMIK